jgi:hypothetical protein
MALPALFTRPDPFASRRTPRLQPIWGYGSAAMLSAQANDADSCLLQKTLCRQSRDGKPYTIR